MYIQEANIFDFDCFVVTIKTKGRLYGDISYQFHRRYPSIEIPDVIYGACSKPIALPDGKFVLFASLWSESERGNGYIPKVVSGCAGGAVRQAGIAGISELAIPLIGGGKKEEMKPHMEEGLRQGLAALKRRWSNMKKEGKEVFDPEDMDINVCSIPRKHSR